MHELLRVILRGKTEDEVSSDTTLVIQRSFIYIAISDGRDRDGVSGVGDRLGRKNNRRSR